jgi:signal transduction histidine kinase
MCRPSGLGKHDFRQGLARVGGAYTRLSMAVIDKRSTLLLRSAGLAACAVSSTPVWVELAQRRGLTPRLALCLAGFLLFAALLWPLTSDDQRCGLSRRSARALLVGLAATGIALHLLLGQNVTGILLVLVASVTADILPRPAAYALLVLQTLAFAAAVAPGMEWWAFVSVAGYATFEVFAFYVSLVAYAERVGREELARVNAELVATRHLLAESSRSAERVRISRELHDVMGHHLAALSLGLEAARHAPEGEVKTHVATAQDLTQRLLEEVRRVVGRLREEPPLDLAGALAALAGGIEAPRVHLSLPDDLRLDDAERAHALVRCAQEVLTNAMKHANARNVWLELAQGADGVELRARDDGRGAAVVAAGNGLGGMRERLERLGGRLAFESAPGRGFQVTAWLPLPGLGAALP